MRNRELLRHLESRFAAAGVESPRVEAEILLRECAGIGALELALDAAREVPAEATERILALAARRELREPLQYLLGKAWFMDLELEVTPAVLIPRPETELLVEWVVERLPRGGRLLDLGTGSGAIALSVASMRPDAEVTGVDVSVAALTVAKRNRRALHLEERVRLLESNLFSGVEGEKFDLVAANLPYVTDSEYLQLAPEVRDYEPRLALTAPDEGFALIEAAAAALPGHLQPGGEAIFELAPHQAGRLAGVLSSGGLFRAVEIRRDLTGRERFVVGMIRPAE